MGNVLPFPDLRKPRRIEDPALLAQVREMRCVVCDKPGPSDPHHIKTVKSGGHDVEFNVLPFCRHCHSLWHRLGLQEFCSRFPDIRDLLIRLGWEFCYATQGRVRLFHPNSKDPLSYFEEPNQEA